MKFFKDTQIIFEQSLNGLTENEVNSYFPQFFQGKDLFIEFYKQTNGGYFTHGAVFYRDHFNIDNLKDYNAMEVESFNFIKSNQYVKSDYLLSICEVIRYRSNTSSKLQNFIKNNIPFAGDAGDNDYWIEIPTGRIRYTHSTDPDWADNIIDIAPSFYDFCLYLQSKRRVL